jgi:murein L,D-transpeptidase YafK
VVIHLSERTLHLCEAGLPAGKYRVAIGKGGAGKRSEGDSKTPIGEYALGAPRASSSFGIFIPISYPTASQRRDGCTGSAIGIHGPSRTFAWAGWMNTAADWTEGCIAVASDEAINEIAAWVQYKDPTVVYLEDD